MAGSFGPSAVVAMRERDRRGCIDGDAITRRRRSVCMRWVTADYSPFSDDFLSRGACESSGVARNRKDVRSLRIDAA
ncbi:hypothetical protein [Lysobacter sp. cf310]|uniref:hypothetical protein n=1 Tax=Lysobacter sp. cf310 TaxID=1761790 RepID=UPI0011133716|nr:hypothetical protein [Lysobacter sp. cf310]